MAEDAEADGPVLHLTLIGEFGNRMIQYMVALKLASLVPGLRISNVHLPDWNIEHPAIESAGPVARIGPWDRIDIQTLADTLNSGRIRRVEWACFGQRMQNFLPRHTYPPVFVADQPVDRGFGGDDLVCPVRAGDILNGDYGDYPLTPVEFYAEVIEQTHLRPVFMGQTEPNAYTDRLRARFPDAVFLATRGPLGDFELIRRARNIVVGVSTFAWLAAWLSDADRIFMTVNGLLNPMQARLVDLLPFGDPRYQFWLFPINYGVPLDWHADVHRRVMPYCRRMTHEMLRQLIAAAPRFRRSLEDMLTEFDEAYYLASNPDVVAAIAGGRLNDGRSHYIGYGFREHRAPFALDRFCYVDQYPLAAFEVAQGDFADLHHHYVAIGKARGYRPTPG